MNLTSLARPLIEASRRLCAAGVLGGTDGNLSQRFPDGTRSDDGEFVHAGSWLITARDAPKASLTPGDVALLSSTDESLAGPEPSSEWQLHRTLYRMRDDVHAVVHAHPPYATALAVAGLALPAEMLADLVMDLGGIPLIPYATPGTDAVGEAVKTHLGQANAALLAQHGAITVADEPLRATARMERLERAAQSFVLARLLMAGAPRTLTGGQVAAVLSAEGRGPS